MNIQQLKWFPYILSKVKMARILWNLDGRKTHLKTSKWNIRNQWVISQQVNKIHPLFSVLNSLCFGSKRILICLLLVFSHITGAFRCRSHVCIFCQSILWPLCDMIIYDHSCTVLLFHSLKAPVSVEPQQMWWGTQSVQFPNSLKQPFSLIWPTLKSTDMVNVWSRTATV